MTVTLNIEPLLCTKKVNLMMVQEKKQVDYQSQ